MNSTLIELGAVVAAAAAAVVSAGFAGMAWYESRAAATRSAESAELAKEQATLAAKSAIVTATDSLHEAWRGLRIIDPDDPVTLDVHDAVRAMQKTAALWTLQGVDKEVIRQICGEDFRALFEALRDCKKEVPGTGRSGLSYLTDEMTATYRELIKT
jgi:hypothetical protein